MSDQNSIYSEIGDSGLTEWAGWIQEAYRTELQWPGVSKEYDRLWRSDSEVTMMRNMYASWASSLDVRFELPSASDVGEETEPSDDDKRALDFANQVLEDVEGGIGKWFTAAMTRVPFYGFGIWEYSPGLRRDGWAPPDDDPWRSQYNDNLIGIRRLGFRRYSSFWKWNFDDYQRPTHMVQLDGKGQVTEIPLERCLHLTFGDSDNPEGLATLESMWRLAKMKQGFEVIFGIGSEHTAGHLSVTVDDEKSFDITNINKAALALMTAQEGNYAAWPSGVHGELIDVPFAAGTTILDAIRHYTIVKLALLGMQWIAFSTISGVGSMASMKDASQIAMGIFNTMAQGFVQQADQQIGKRLFEYDVNQAAFPGLTRRPQLTVNTLQKEIDLAELGSFATAISALMPLGDDDYIAIRKRSEVLPETLPVEENSNDDDTTGNISPDTQLYGYHFENGVVEVNEARRQLGLPPKDDEDVKRRQDIIAKLGVMKAAIEAGLSEEEARALSGIDKEPEVTTLPDEPADEPEEPEPETESVTPEEAEEIIEQVLQTVREADPDAFYKLGATIQDDND